MQKRKPSVLLLIYGVTIVPGVLLNWFGISVVSAVLLVFWWREFVKIPFLAPMTQNRDVEYTGPIFIGIVFMWGLGFLSDHYGWRYVFTTLDQAFLRQ